MTAIENLVSILQVKPDGDNRFIGNPGPGKSRIFGGLTVAQAIDAARQCCPDNYSIQSIHGQFLRPGDKNQNIVIDVEELKDGRRFKLYNVYCRQLDKVIFFATITFHLPEPSFQHTLKMPDVTLPGEDKAVFYKYRHDNYTKEELGSDKAAFEVRLEQEKDRFIPLEPENITWIRAIESDELSDWQKTLLIAYCSDWNMPRVAINPHILPEGYQPNMASLDHAIWFYRQADLGDWLSFVQDSPAAENSRGHSRGLIYSKQGELLACVNQECFLSMKKIET